jgi:hypothetical protein
MMTKTPPAANPDAYLAALSGWRKPLVESLRSAVVASAKFDEVIKWGHLVYLSNGPVLLIRAEDERVLFGFWRGKRLLEVDPRLKASGKYEMATIELREGATIDPTQAGTLAKKAVALNRRLGDPTQIARD